MFLTNFFLMFFLLSILEIRFFCLLNQCQAIYENFVNLFRHFYIRISHFQFWRLNDWKTNHFQYYWSIFGKKNALLFLWTSIFTVFVVHLQSIRMWFTQNSFYSIFVYNYGHIIHIFSHMFSTSLLLNSSIQISR